MRATPLVAAVLLVHMAVAWLLVPHGVASPPIQRPQPPPPPPAVAPPTARPPPPAERFLIVETMSGLTNQRLCIINGLALAHALNATLVLPPLWASLDRFGAANVEVKSSRVVRPEGDQAQEVPFSTFFDVAAFRRRLAGLVQIVPQLPKHLARANLRAAPIFDHRRWAVEGRDYSLAEIKRRFLPLVERSSVFVVRFGIPWRLWVPVGPDEQRLWTRFNQALRFAPTIRQRAEATIAALRGGGDSSSSDGKAPFVALHLRREEFYRLNAHGREGASPREAVELLHYDWCLPADTRIYLLGGELGSDVVEPLREANMSGVVVHDTLLPGDDLPSQIQAAVDFEVARASTFLVSNSAISTFDWILWRMRRRRGVCQLQSRDPSEPVRFEKVVTSFQEMVPHCRREIPSIQEPLTELSVGCG